MFFRGKVSILFLIFDLARRGNLINLRVPESFWKQEWAMEGLLGVG